MNGSRCPRLIDGEVCGGYVISDPFAGKVCEQCGNVIEDVDTLRSELESQHYDSGSGSGVGNYVAADDNGSSHYVKGGYADAIANRQHTAKVLIHKNK